MDPLDVISELVRRRAGLLFSESRRTSLRMGVDRAFARSGHPDLAGWLRALEADPDVLDDLLIELTVGETFFFRDPQHFDRVRDEALPALLSRRPTEQPLRLWSAGCATGEEPYSLAMLLADLGLLGRAQVLGTDISRASLSRAERGVYRPWSLRGQGKPRALKHLSGTGQRYEVPQRLRANVRFEYLNLAVPGWPSLGTGVFGMDVIFCRNVLIYFGEDTIRQVLERFCATLSPGGWLVLGPSDPLVTDLPQMETLVRPEGLYYRRRDPSVETKEPLPRAKLHPAPRPPPSSPTAPPAPPPPAPRLPPTPAAPPAHADLRTQPPPEDERIVQIRMLANRNLPQALNACVEAVAEAPLSAPLQFLMAVLLLEVGRLEEAREAARRALYLDGSLEVVQHLLGTIFRRLGQKERAVAAFERAAGLAGRRPPDEKVPLGEGATAAQLKEAAEGAAAVAKRE